MKPCVGLRHAFREEPREWGGDKRHPVFHTDYIPAQGTLSKPLKNGAAGED